MVNFQKIKILRNDSLSRTMSEGSPSLTLINLTVSTSDSSGIEAWMQVSNCTDICEILLTIRSRNSSSYR